MSPDFEPDLLPSLAVFALVCESGSFSDAARRLGSTRSAVSKHVQRLEERWGTHLLHRTTRSLSLTEPGRLAYEHAAQVARSATAARAAVDSLASAPRGLLKVTTSVSYGRAVLLDLMPAFLRAHPEVELDVLLLDRFVDLAEEGIDVALRLTSQPPDLSIAQRLCPIEYHVVARAGSRLARRIREPADLRNVDSLHYSRAGGLPEWRFHKAGRTETVRMRGRVAINSSESIASLAEAGLGVAVAPDYAVRAHLQERRLVRLLEGWTVEGAFGDAVWMLRLPERAVLPKVRAFMSYLSRHAGRA